MLHRLGAATQRWSALTDRILCRGVVHRDLKLENLLLATPNDIHKVKIADFGLAKKAAESAMATICGTPQYVAPEVIQVLPPLAISCLGIDCTYTASHSM